MRARPLFFGMVALLLLHSANVVWRASSARPDAWRRHLSLSSEKPGQAKQAGGVGGIRRPRAEGYMGGGGRSVSKREKVAMWLERVAAGAASVPPQLLAGSDAERGKRHWSGKQLHKLAATATMPASLQRLRDITARVEAEEASLSNSSVIWPRVFIIGAPKAASSTLSRLLSWHPQICKAKALLQGTVAKEVGILLAHRLKVRTSAHPYH